MAVRDKLNKINQKNEHFHIRSCSKGTTSLWYYKNYHGTSMKCYKLSPQRERATGRTRHHARGQRRNSRSLGQCDRRNIRSSSSEKPTGSTSHKLRLSRPPWHPSWWITCLASLLPHRWEGDLLTNITKIQKIIITTASRNFLQINNIFLGRWRFTLDLFGRLFVDDVGLEPGSIISELGGFPVKEAKFRREMEKLRNSRTVDLTLSKIERDRNQLIVQVGFVMINTLKSSVGRSFFILRLFNQLD